MANKRVTSVDDPLTQVIIRIPQSQKQFLEKLDESISSFIRKLIASQMSGHEVEIHKLEEENRQHEAYININNAQINELKAACQRKQAASKTREELIEAIVERLSSGTRVIDFKDRGFTQMFNNNLGDANRVLNGNGEPITYDELKDQLVTKARMQGRVVRV